VNARQQAEYDDAIARMRLGATLRLLELPPRSEPATGSPEALTLASKLLEHVSSYSVVDRRSHALGVARMILGEQGP
jgi:hypothetical protein